MVGLAAKPAQDTQSPLSDDTKSRDKSTEAVRDAATTARSFLPLLPVHKTDNILPLLRTAEV